MRNYSDKLTQLISKTKALETKKENLITKRKNEIALLAANYELLTVPDTILQGAFSEISEAMKLKSPKIKQWEAIGLKTASFSQQLNSATKENPNSIITSPAKI